METYKDKFLEWSKNNNINLIHSMNGYDVGEDVIFTNDNGVWFKFKILGFDLKSNFIYLNKHYFWFPVRFNQIVKYNVFRDEMSNKHNLSIEDVNYLIHQSEISGFDYFYLFHNKD